MLTFDEARARLLAEVRGVGIERVPLGRAAGRVLAEELVAKTPLPRWDHSAMDGYAVATKDFGGEGPWTLRVAGESAAGREAPALVAGAACRVFTGARVPAGADAVVMQEVVAREGDLARFQARPEMGAHIRRAGEDLAQGAVAIARGARLSAGALALAGMLDRAELLVARRPIVTIVCTGDELRAPGEAAGAAGIPESNSAPIAALARQAGAVVHVAPIARDDPEGTERAIEDALRGTDLLVTIGGVSVGDHDVVRPSLERAGVTLDFWKVAIKPGKPLCVGRAARAHVIGLPGNPASAMVTFAAYGMPLLRAMQGDARPVPLPMRARFGAARWKRAADRLELARVVLAVEGGEVVAKPHTNQASGAATSLATSDGLAFVPQGNEPLAPDARVDVLRWTDL